jgi:hypothetical protein
MPPRSTEDCSVKPYLQGVALLAGLVGLAYTGRCVALRLLAEVQREQAELRGDCCGT